jgi:hypothetical protein
MSSDREHPAGESDMTPACREMIAQLARRAKERRSRGAPDAAQVRRAGPPRRGAGDR